MSIFDFFNKKKPVQTSSAKQKSDPPSVNSNAKTTVQNQSLSQKPTVNSSASNPTSLDTLVKSAVPSRQGLYPHEILMLEYAPKFNTLHNSFQSFWRWDYSVLDPQALLRSLLNRGFIKEDNLKSTLDKLKLPEIKEELKLIGQPVTGKKSELIDRLLQFGNMDQLNIKFPERYFILTEKGERELKENQYVIYLHRNKYMNVWEMNRRIAQTDQAYRDILWGYFNEQSLIHIRDYDFGFYINTRLNMYRFLMEENRTQTAFHILCEILSYNLTVLSNGDKTLFHLEKSDMKLFLPIYEEKINDFFSYTDPLEVVPPEISRYFADMQKALNLDDEGLRSAVINEVKEVHPPHRMFTDKECADIVIANLHNDADTLNAIYRSAEKREQTRLHNLKAGQGKPPYLFS